MPSGSMDPWGKGVLATPINWAAPPEERTYAPRTSSADISMPMNARYFTGCPSIQIVCRRAAAGSLDARRKALLLLLESVEIIESHLAQLDRAKDLAQITVKRDLG